MRSPLIWKIKCASLEKYWKISLFSFITKITECNIPRTILIHFINLKSLPEILKRGVQRIKCSKLRWPTICHIWHYVLFSKMFTYGNIHYHKIDVIKRWSYNVSANEKARPHWLLMIKTRESSLKIIPMESVVLEYWMFKNI